VLRVRSRPLPLDAARPFVVFSPHPDDETLGCGGTIALLCRSRVDVRIVFVTDGSQSHPSHPTISPGEIASIRCAEAQRATESLGVGAGAVSFLGARDGMLALLDGGDSDRLAAQIKEVLEQMQPEAILLPCRLDGSSEHEAVFALVNRALAESSVKARIYEFPVWSLWSPQFLLRNLFTYAKVWRSDISKVHEMKLRALACYPSQAYPLAPDTQAALPSGFVSMFQGRDEFLFEA